MGNQSQNNIQDNNEMNITSQYEINITNQQNQNQQIQEGEDLSNERLFSIINEVQNILNDPVNIQRRREQENAILQEWFNRDQVLPVDDNEEQNLGLDIDQCLEELEIWERNNNRNN